VIRCPSCGGLNPEKADWCGQCLRRFTPPPAPAPDAAGQGTAEGTAPDGSDAASEEASQGGAASLYLVETLPTAADAAPKPHSPVERMSAPPGVKTTRGPFTVSEQGVTWTCATCGSVNAMESEICSACGSTLHRTLSPGDGGPRKQRDPRLTAMVSLAYPGVGHAYLGMWGQAIARITIATWMLAAVIAGLSVEAAGARVLAVVFVLIAFGMWGVSAHDAFREAQNQQRLTILKGRAFLYLVVGLLALLFLQLFLGAQAGTEAVTLGP
jgi:hypothetical protein